MDINQLGYFQFDNLIQNRVPFILLNLGVNLDHLYSGFWAMHLHNVNTPCTPSEAVAKVQEKKVPNHYAIVIIDADGSQSMKLVPALEKAGFTNTYYVKGGLQGLDQEKKNSQLT
jgi:rhodanese-related sulfurtransferase